VRYSGKLVRLALIVAEVLCGAPSARKVLSVCTRLALAIADGFNGGFVIRFGVED
jgi:hypothetical protein